MEKLEKTAEESQTLNQNLGRHEIYQKLSELYKKAQRIKSYSINQRA